MAVYQKVWYVKLCSYVTRSAFKVLSIHHTSTTEAITAKISERIFKSSVTSHPFQFLRNKSEGKDTRGIKSIITASLRQITIFRAVMKSVRTEKHSTLMFSGLCVQVWWSQLWFVVFFRTTGLPVPARSEYETVATRGDSCSIDFTLFIKGGFLPATH